MHLNREDDKIRVKTGSIIFITIAIPKVKFQKVGFLKSIKIYTLYTSKLQQIKI